MFFILFSFLYRGSKLDIERNRPKGRFFRFYDKKAPGFRRTPEDDPSYLPADRQICHNCIDTVICIIDKIYNITFAKLK